MLKKLRIKFVCINMGVVAAMLVVMCVMILGYTRRNLELESTEQLRAALMGRLEPRGFGFGLRQGEAGPELREPEQGEGLLGSLLYIRVTLNKEGAILGCDGNFDFSALDLPLEELAAAAEGEGGVLREWNLRYLRGHAPAGEMLVFGDISGEQDTLRDLARTLLLIGGLSLLGFLLLSILLAVWAVRPVEEAWKQQKQFVSDASHELKTPLTVIMTNAELLQSPDYDAAARQRFGENILTMSRQMRGLVEGLLELARVEGGAAAAQQQGEVDFSALCEAAVLPFEPVCFERGLSLASQVEPGLTVRGSGSHLRQAAEILLDNAAKYAEPGTEVTLRLARSGRNCVLSVADRGAPIAPEDMKHLFERFYRADKARSRDGSYGLGLSIAQKITEAHRGKIWAESAGGLNTFFISLPLARPAGRCGG